MIELNGRTNKGQDIMFYLYWLGVLAVIILLTIHTKFWEKKDEKAHNGQSPFENCECCPPLAGLTYNQIIHVLTACSMICAIIYMALSALDYHQVSQDHLLSCKIRLLFPALGYFCHKYSIYECLVVRLQSAFSGSVFEYKSKVIITLHMAVYSCLIFSMILAVFGGTFYGDPECYIDYPFWVIVFIPIIDFLLNVTILYLFTKPLIILTRQQHWYMLETNIAKPPVSEMITVEILDLSPQLNSFVKTTSSPTTEFAKTSDLYNLLVRVTILTFMMILITIFNIILYVSLSWTVGFIIDLVINCLCLLLTFVKYKRFYFFFCSCCHWVLGNVGRYGLRTVDRHKNRLAK